MMVKYEDIFKLATGERASWLKHLEQVPLSELADIDSELQTAQQSLQTLAERISWARDDVSDRAKNLVEAGEQKKRQQRRTRRRMSLREFFQQPASEPDRRLRELSLCTKSGAEMRLEALTFQGQQEIASLNGVRDRFRVDQKCSAHWHLYYIRNGERSAGYGWDKPFLDEVFVILE